MKKCIICSKTIKQLNRRKYCSSACMDAAERIVRKKHNQARGHHITCVVCGADYAASSRTVKTCGDPACRHAFLSTIRRVHKKQLRPVTQAKCPGCGVMHNHVFLPPWTGNGTPRIKCSRYPWCMNSTDIAQYGSVYEIENGARI